MYTTHNFQSNLIHSFILRVCGCSSQMPEEGNRFTGVEITEVLSYPQWVLVSELSSSVVEVLLTTAHYFSSSQRIILTKRLEAVTQNSKYLQECFNSSLHSDELIRKSNKIYVKTKSLAQDTNDKAQPVH